MKDAMIDLETFSLRSTASIVTIGVVMFDADSTRVPSAAAGWGINLQSAILTGGHFDPATAKWWKQQTKSSIHDITSGGMHIKDALIELNKWFRLHEPDRVWANGAANDITWLMGAYERNKVDIPWKYNAVRDTRTLWWLAKSCGWERSAVEVAHSAIKDAGQQAVDVASALDFLRRRDILPKGVEI